MWFNIVDSTTKYNNNHIIIDTTQEVANRPKFQTHSIFKDVLYFINKTEYTARYQTTSLYASLDDVLDTRTNIVSYVDPKESWVVAYMAKVRAALIRRLNDPLI
jgi:hypothetical protein